MRRPIALNHVHKFSHHSNRLPVTFASYFTRTSLSIIMTLETSVISIFLVHALHLGKGHWNIKAVTCGTELPESLKLIQSTPVFKSSLMVFLLTTVWTGITDLCTFVPFAPCTLHFAVNWFCVIVFCYNGWPAKIGFMPFWQPSTLCFDAVSFTAVLLYRGE